ncbi:EAL domain-containing protein [Methylobacterium symbioticum]|nr:EAL domain-containing protein [uncultured Methylobacterium sp.]
MFRFLGRHASLWAFGLLAAVVLGPLAVFLPQAGALALAALAGLAALAAHARAAALKTRCDVLSREVDTLSKRLLRTEAETGAPARPDADRAALVSDIEDLSVEIGLLSGIVRDLTTVVTAQDEEVARLKAAAQAAPVPPPPAPRPAPEPAQPERTKLEPAMAEPAMPEPRPEPRVEPRSLLPRPFPPRPVPPLPLSSSRAAPPAEPPRPVLPRGTALPEEALVAAFEGDGLEVHLQPVVTLPQRKVVAYEALARLRAGADLVAPEIFLPVLERHGRTTELDRRMLQRVLTIARHLGGRGSEASITYGLSPLSLFEPGFLRWLARLVGGETGLGGRIVLALPQASWRGLDAEQAAALAGLRGRVGFTLDRPTDLRFDAAALAARGVGQIKVPAGLLLRPARADLADIAPEDLVTALARSGIRLVACGVEAEADVPDLIDLDVALAQGTAFAAPRPVRAEVLASPVPEPGPETDPEPPQRKPFRSFLRRAV